MNVYLQPTLPGDPIEMGAATEVFSGPAAANRLTGSFKLASSKSWFGHGEPAAGVVGIAHSLLSHQQQAQLPIMHLRTINPLVESVLEEAAAGGRGAGGGRSFQMSRQQVPVVLQQATANIQTGISAFAFQVGPWWKLLVYV